MRFWKKGSFLLMIALCAASVSLAQNDPTIPLPPSENDSRCARLFKLAVELLVGVRKDFKHSEDYSHANPATEVKDQCGYGGCWVYGTLARLEGKLLQRLGKKMDLSEQYVIAQSLIYRVLDALRTPGQTVTEGGFPSGAEWIIAQEGIIPQGTWEPRIKFEDSKAAKQLMFFLNNRVAQYHLEAAGKPENAALHGKAQQDVMDILRVYFGDLPKTIKYEGKTYTPKEFADQYVKEDLGHIEEYKAVRDPLPPELEKLNDDASDPDLQKKNTIQTKLPRHTLPMKEIVEKMKNAVLAGEDVSLALYMNRVFIDNETGIMSIGAFHHPEGMSTNTLLYQLNFGPELGAHLVNVVGVDIDPATGQVIKFKIKNSWGLKYGTKGYYHLYVDYLDAYMMSTYLRNKN